MITLRYQLQILLEVGNGRCDPSKIERFRHNRRRGDSDEITSSDAKTMWQWEEIESSKCRIDSVIDDEMKARHRAAKGTRYSYDDYEDDDDGFMDDDDDSITASQGNRLLGALLITRRSPFVQSDDGRQW